MSRCRGNPHAPLPQNLVQAQWLAGHYKAPFFRSQWIVGQLSTKATCGYDTARNENPNVALSDRQLLDSLSRTPFIDSAELAWVLGEAHATVHRALTGLLADGIVGRANHGTAHLTSSHRYYLTPKGIRQAVELLGFATLSDFVRAYPASRGVAGAPDTSDGRGGRRLPSRLIALPRHRRAPIARGVPPQRPVRRHHHPPRRPNVWCGPPGPGPYKALNGAWKGRVSQPWASRRELRTCLLGMVSRYRCVLLISPCKPATSCAT